MDEREFLSLAVTRKEDGAGRRLCAFLAMLAILVGVVALGMAVGPPQDELRAGPSPVHAGL